MTEIERIIQGLMMIQMYEPDTKVDTQLGVILAGDYISAYENMEQSHFDRLVQLGWDQSQGRWAFYTLRMGR